MNAANCDAETECRKFITSFFEAYPNDALRDSSLKALRMVAAAGSLVRGTPGAWAGGIIYGLSNRYRIRCGIPGILNKDIERFFGATMNSIRTRATQLNRFLDI